MPNNKKDPITEENLLNNLEYNSANRKQEIKDFIISKAKNDDVEFFNKICSQSVYPNRYNRFIKEQDNVKDPRLCMETINDFKKLNISKNSLSNATSSSLPSGSTISDGPTAIPTSLPSDSTISVGPTATSSSLPSGSIANAETSATVTVNSSLEEKKKDFLKQNANDVFNTMTLSDYNEFIKELEENGELNEELKEKIKTITNLKRGYCNNLIECKDEAYAKTHSYCQTTYKTKCDSNGGKKKSKKAKKSKKSKKSRKTRKSKKAKKTAKK
jgi:hypothetical protein